MASLCCLLQPIQGVPALADCGDFKVNVDCCIRAKKVKKKEAVSLRKKEHILSLSSCWKKWRKPRIAHSVTLFHACLSVSHSVCMHAIDQTPKWSLHSLDFHNTWYPRVQGGSTSIPRCFAALLLLMWMRSHIWRAIKKKNHNNNKYRKILYGSEDHI